MVRVLKVAMTGERTPISKKPDTEENDIPVMEFDFGIYRHPIAH